MNLIQVFDRKRQKGISIFMRMSRPLSIAAIVLFAFALTFCQRPDVSRLNWEAEVLVPLASGTIGVQDLVTPPLSIGNSNSDSAAVSLFYDYPLYSLQLSEYISVPDTSYEDAISLDSLFLPDQTIEYPVTLGQLARNDPSGQGQILILFHGNYAPIPAINNLSSTDAPIDATTFFESAEIDSGYMDITIRNGFKVDITDLSFTLKNASDGAAVVNGTIPLIPAGATEVRTYSLQGANVEGQLLADIDNLSTPGSSGPVLIDTTDALDLSITVRDLKLRSARAIFPAQNLVNAQNITTYNMGGPEFTYMEIESGQLLVTAFNTIEDSLYLDYSIPTAVDPNGQIIDIRTVVNPAPPGGSENVQLSYDLSNFTIDLKSLRGDRVNTFDNIFRVSIDSSGNLIYISLDDSVSVFYGLVDIIPKYVRGYMGREQLSIGPEVARINFFDQFTGGSLSFEELFVNFKIINPFGVDGSATVNGITARNSKTGETVPITAPFIGQTIQIERAYENPNRLGITRLPLTKQNSNIEEVLAIFPDEFVYAIDLDINPNGNFYNYQDFARFADALVASLDMELPLSLQADDLRLEKVSPFDISGNATINNIRSGTLYLNADNNMPLSARVQVYFLDEQGGVLDSLSASPLAIAAGTLSNDCQSVSPASTRIEVSVEEEKMLRIQQAEEVRFSVTFNDAATQQCGPYVRLRNTDDIQLSLSGRFNYAVGE